MRAAPKRSIFLGIRSKPAAAGEASSRARKGKTDRHHPATSDREYSADELEFLAAVQGYKTRTGRKFPTNSEVLSILKSLGYAKPDA